MTENDGGKIKQNAQSGLRCVLCIKLFLKEFSLILFDLRKLVRNVGIK